MSVTIVPNEHQIARVCERCGQTFVRMRSYFRRPGRGKFCSAECRRGAAATGQIDTTPKTVHRSPANSLSRRQPPVAVDPDGEVDAAIATGALVPCARRMRRDGRGLIGREHYRERGRPCPICETQGVGE